MSYPSTVFHRCIPTLALSKSGKVGLTPSQPVKAPSQTVSM